MRNFIWAIVLLSIGVSITSCSDSDRDEDNTTLASADNSFAEHFYNDIFKVVHRVIVHDTLLYGADTTLPFESCIDTIYKVPNSTSYPIKLVIDYGKDSLICPDGRMRFGKLNVTLNGPYGTSGSSMVIAPDSFTINEYRVEGLINIQFENSTGDYSPFQRKVTNGHITDNDIGYYKKDVFYESDQRVDLINVSDTANGVSDVFWVTGTSTGRNSRGAFFDAQIVTPIQFQLDCIYESLGTYNLQVNNLSPRFVEFGGCDQDIVVKINGGDHYVSLPH